VSVRQSSPASILYLNDVLLMLRFMYMDERRRLWCAFIVRGEDDVEMAKNAPMMTAERFAFLVRRSIIIIMT